MNTNDPIEELFRKRSNETVGEKPRDLVWKRIESGLQNEEKKKKPIREFVSSVWFSAAVFALIAIPYFVLFIENINTENRENSIEVVKMNTPAIENKVIQQEKLEILESKDEILDKPIEIVKNKKVVKEPVYKVVEENSIGESTNGGYLPEFSKASVPESPALLSAPRAIEARSKTLDSIEKEGQYAVAKASGYIKDSVSKKENTPFKIKGVNYSSVEDSNKRMKMTVVAEERSANLETSSVLAVAPKKSAIDKALITYKPLKFTVKSDILRTTFKLLKKSKDKITFENTTNRVVITFEKSKDKIILTTNQPKMDAVLLGTLEKNKKEIFEYYQIK